MAGIDPLVLACVSALALVAGGITTIAGLGGGMLLLAALSVLFDPHTALAWTAPALLLGNAHRAWLYRRAVDWRTVGVLAAGIVPASLAGGLVVAALPPAIVAGTILTVALLGLANSAGWLRWRPSLAATVPLGALAGFITAAGGGGAGVIVGPILLARELTALPYVATMAWLAVALHGSRLLAYGAAGVADRTDLAAGLALALLITLGNLLGDRLRRTIGAHRQRQAQVGALGLCVVMATAGLWA